MKKKILCCALLGLMGAAQGVAAQEVFDDRWYVTAGFGYGMFDGSRNVDDNFTGQIGVGKFIAPRWSWDAELFYANPEDNNADLNWSMYSGSLVGRYHMRDEGDTWWPYLSFGAGMARAEDESAAFNNQGPTERKDNNLLLLAGMGLQADWGRYGARAELGSRWDFDDRSGISDDFNDWVASVSLVVKLGDLPEPPAAEPPPPPPPPVKTCADMDDDGDGVNNCEDKCPNSQAGQAVGPDGCPVPLTIDLRGVNFDFDKATLRPDAIAILDEAVGILSKYPEIRVEVAGHTDLCGSDGYNQKLSESRAKAVFDYLTSKGIAASRMSGPTGYGESRPLESTAQSFPGCKSEKNRRTELNVQN
ncbi:OmpA family protein [Pseudomarimonas salicorniae]|uniref:OmpA family protein n=1 Tax=Pseudomarimonas salicorniae TaxID=2933270 RepID=A0ABT0GIL5_9GAMM|nr:OmpA family protein [Lysobacter sp. CAU 1642]MCK7593862.1 OmpA family protein [Lysobacter sp. CAU 1642]